MRPATTQLPVHAVRRETVGEPYAGNPHVRFDEGEQAVHAGCLLSTLLRILFSQSDSGEVSDQRLTVSGGTARGPF